MNGTVIFLTSVWAPGYGVSVVIAEQCRVLSAAGWRCVVGAVRVGTGMPTDIDVVRLPFVPVLLRKRLESLAPSLVLACTPPFPAALAGWRIPWIHWEHGRADQPEGTLALEPSAAQRAGPSRWLVSRFAPSGVAIANGADHLGRQVPSPRPGAPLRVVAALRGGSAEARYKGNDLLLSLPHLVGRPDMSWHLLLRDGSATAERFREAGWDVVPDPSRTAMAEMWRKSDLHLAPSRIESFDLPLAEAQHLGCAGLALEGGAHRELCLNVFSAEADLVAFLQGIDRGGADALRAAAFAHMEPYTWERHGEALLALVASHARPWRGPVPGASLTRLLHALASLGYDLLRRWLR